MITTHPEGDDKIVVPSNYQSDLLKSFHEMDHSGMDHTEARLKLYYYWYSMQADVRLFVQSCTSCQVSKLTRNVVNNRNLIVWSIMDQVSLDFIGPLQRTTNEHQYILIAIEHFLAGQRHTLLPSLMQNHVLRACIKAYFPGLVTAEFYIQTVEVLSFLIS